MSPIIADQSSDTECIGLKKFYGVYDECANAHQTLPFFATLAGFDWKLVVIVFYIAETFEVLTWCIQGSFKETMENSIVQDPISGFVGVFVALCLKYLFNSKGICSEVLKFESNMDVFYTVLDLAVIILTTLFLHKDPEINKNYEYFYILLMSGAYLFLFIYKIQLKIISDDEKSKFKMLFLHFTIYITLITAVNTSRPLDVNSFYSTCITGLSYGIVILIFALIQNQNSSDIKYIDIKSALRHLNGGNY